MHLISHCAVAIDANRGVLQSAVISCRLALFRHIYYFKRDRI